MSVVETQDQSLGKATKVLCQATLGEALGVNPDRPKLGDEGLADGAQSHGPTKIASLAAMPWLKLI